MVISEYIRNIYSNIFDGVRDGIYSIKGRKYQYSTSLELLIFVTFDSGRGAPKRPRPLPS